MSGFLARYVQSGELSLQSARDGWFGSESILEAAWQRYDQIMTEQVSQSESRQSDSPSEVIVSKPVQHSQSEAAGYTKAMLQNIYISNVASQVTKVTLSIIAYTFMSFR